MTFLRESSAMCDTDWFKLETVLFSRRPEISREIELDDDWQVRQKEMTQDS